MLLPFSSSLLVSLTVLSFCTTGNRAYDINFEDVLVNEEIVGVINVNHQNVYRFNISSSQRTNDTYLRVEFSSSVNSHSLCPIHFILRQDNEVQTINLPQAHEATNLTLYSGARTLCMHQADWLSSSIFVTVSSCSRISLSYSFSLSVYEGYLIRLTETKTAYRVSATAPVLYQFDFPDDVDFVTIYANSTTKSKTILSIQPIECPVHDELSNIKHTGHFHLMSQITSMIVQKRTYPDGFLLIFLPDGRSNSDRRTIDPSQYETISFTVFGNDKEIFVSSLCVPLVIYLVVIIVVYLMYSYFHHLYMGNEHGKRLAPPNFQSRCHKHLCDTELRVEHFTTDENLYKYLKENSYRYIWTILIIVFFYGFPVILLSLTLTNFQDETGDLDTCNFNYHCSYPVFVFVSFNRVFSSFGYVILGLAFMFLVHLRARALVVNEAGIMGLVTQIQNVSWKFYRFRKVDLSRTGYGAYQNFGTFYSLGFSLMMVGIMKMAFNICPNRDSTFFGLTFMFIVVLLCQIKIYSLRHPCMITDNFTFVSIGIVVGAIVLGYLFNHDILQIIISAFISFWIQVTILVLQSAGYAVERVDAVGINLILNDATTTGVEGNAAPEGGTGVQQDDMRLITSPLALFRNVFCKCNFRHLFFPEERRRIFWPVLRLFLNIGILCLIWFKMTQNHFTTRMYVLVLANFLMDFVYYFVILKCCHQEYSKRISWQPIIYLLCAIILWIASLLYLADSIAAWELPSILFQEYFKSCKFGIYDGLDMYHWLGAGAFFFTFMVMLTADDPLSRISTEMTVVF